MMIVGRAVRNQDRILLHLPQEIRRAMDVQPGHLVQWQLLPDGRAVIANITPIIQHQIDQQQPVPA